MSQAETINPENLSFNSFQVAALRTWNRDITRYHRISNACMGLSGEVGEVIEPLKKYMYHGKPAPDTMHMRKEIGDVLYYCAVLANELGFGLQDCADDVIAKLIARHPEGFNVESKET